MVTDTLSELIEAGRVVVLGDLFYSVDARGVMILIGWEAEAERWVTSTMT